ncbi:MAG: DUF6683 family protein [Trueperaceae bacterium]
MFKRFVGVLLFVVLVSFGFAQLFDSIGGTLKDANLGSTLSNGVAPVDANAPVADLSFTPTGERLIFAEFDKLAATQADATPEQLEQFKSVLDELLTAIDEEIKRVGENPHDMGTAVAAFFEFAYSSYHNFDPAREIPDPQSLAAVNQFRTLLSQNPDVTAMDNEQRQLFYEAAAGLPAMFAAFQQYAIQQGDTAMADQWRTQVMTLFKDISGLDISQVQYTDQGVTVAGAGQNQTAAPQQTTPTNSTATNPTPANSTTPSTNQTNNSAGTLSSNPLGNPASVNSLGGSSGTNPLAAGTTEPFVGNFSGDNITLTLQGTNSSYTGELTFNGQPFPVKATATGTDLTGTFTSGGNTFNFTATLQNKTLSLTSDGSTFNLVKE